MSGSTIEAALEPQQRITDAVYRPRPDERKAELDRALQRFGASGWRTENRSDYQATVAAGKEINHRLHLIVSVFTAGLWAFVWIVLALFGGVKRRMLTVDEFGNLVTQKL